MIKPTYLVDLLLPNNLLIPNLPVTEINSPIDNDGNVLDYFGILIGMDIITMGDFSVTNFEGSTSMSFRIPSMAKIDFVAEWKERI